MVVTYHGIVGGEAKRRLLKECYIFALPTRYPNEGQPISILEAILHIIKALVITVCDDGMTHFLELSQIINHY